MRETKYVHDNNGHCKESFRLFAVFDVAWILGNAAALRDKPRGSLLGMLRVGHVASCLERCRCDINGKQPSMDEGRHGRVEQPENVNREFGDQEEGTQDTNSQVIVRGTIVH